MERANDVEQGGGAETQRWEVAGGTQRARVMPQRHCDAQGIPPGTLAVNNVGAEKQKQSESAVLRADEKSGAAAWRARRSVTIHQNIIGRRVTVGASGFRGGMEIPRQDGTFALFHEPASEHGSGVLLEPLIEQFANLLAEVGGMAETRKLVGLQGSAGSGEKEFPGSLGTKLRHGALPKDGIRQYHRDINTEVIDKASTFRISRLWKVVENEGAELGLCSGCAGDYEDPDRSAWEEEKDEMDEVKEAEEVKEEE